MESRIVLLPVTMDEFLQSIQTLIASEFQKHSKREEEKLLSPAETCKLFQPNISKVTLATWTKQGKLQEYRIGGRVYYRSSEVLEKLQSLKRYQKIPASR